MIMTRLDPLWRQWPVFAVPMAAAASMLAVLLTIWAPFFGLLAIATLAGVAVCMIAFRWPIVLVAALLAIAPFNYGKPIGGAVLKLSELVAIAMLLVGLARLAAGDGEAWARLRRGGWVVTALALLGLMAILTALPHPHLFNVRYEIYNYIALAYALLFFRRRHWPLLVSTVATVLLVESLTALTLKFVFRQTGWAFFEEGGGLRMQRFTSEDLESFAGGKFRISGTLGHKNMLAGFIILLTPLVGLEALRRPSVRWLPVLLPTLIALALSDSMTGWGALLLIVVLVLLHLRRFDYLAVLILLVIPLGGFALIRYGESVFYRIEQLFFSYEGLNTVRSRLIILNISGELIGKYPWLGIGRQNFQLYGETFYGHAHNLFLMKCIEMGVPAGIAFAGVMVAMMARIWLAILREANRLGLQGQYYRTLGLWLGCLGFLAMNLFDYNYQHFSLGPILMAWLGIGLAVAWDVEPAA